MSGPPAKVAAAPPWRIAVDVGGTFTDVVVAAADGALYSFKALSQPADAKGGVLAALDVAARGLGLNLGDLVANCGLFVHGSTVATNTILQGTGSRVGLLTTEGFRDSLEIRRGIRPNPWDHRSPFPPVMVPRYLRLPVVERIDRHGEIHTPLEIDSVYRALEILAAEDVDAVAICLLNSYLNPIHETAVAEAVRAAAPGLWVSVSSALAPIAGEYERLSTTVVDAYVAPGLVSYLRDLDRELKGLGLDRPMLLVKNNGGTAGIDEVAREPVVLTLSGPAAVVGALNSFRQPAATDNMISLEVGGTSCDVVVMTDGGVTVTDRLAIGSYDTVVPSVEVNTVGAGGGTVAGVDRAGVLYVGPRGAGARPGPACYGRGGVEPTVTDAQLVLGRLGTGPYAGGALTLDPDLARVSVHDNIAVPLGITTAAAAAGIVEVIEQRILHAVSFISVQRGLDPRSYTLVAGGGAGGLHAAAVARMLGCRSVYVPRRAGVLCAYGMLNSDVRHDYVQSYIRPLDSIGGDEIERALEKMRVGAASVLQREGFDAGDTYFERALDIRYQGQQWDVRVVANGGACDPGALRADFEAIHDRLYGHRQPESRVEVVKLRLTGFGRLAPPGRVEYPAGDALPDAMAIRQVYLDPESGLAPVPVYAGPDLMAGHCLTGPLIVEEETTTVLAGPNDRLTVDGDGNYLIGLAASGGDI